MSYYSTKKNILDITTVARAKADVLEWMVSTQGSLQGSPAHQKIQTDRSSWSPPPVGWVKCNFERNLKVILRWKNQSSQRYYGECKHVGHWDTKTLSSKETIW